MTCGTPSRSQLITIMNFGNESNTLQMSHEHPCISVADSSASSRALVTWTVGSSVLFFRRDAYCLKERDDSHSLTEAMRPTIIPIQIFRVVSSKAIGWSSSRVAISGSTLGMGYINFHCHHSKIVSVSHIWNYSYHHHI